MPSLTQIMYTNQAAQPVSRISDTEGMVRRAVQVPPKLEDFPPDKIISSYADSGPAEPNAPPRIPITLAGGQRKYDSLIASNKTTAAIAKFSNGTQPIGVHQGQDAHADLGNAHALDTRGIRIRLPAWLTDLEGQFKRLFGKDKQKPKGPSKRQDGRSIPASFIGNTASSNYVQNANLIGQGSSGKCEACRFLLIIPALLAAALLFALIYVSVKYIVQRMSKWRQTKKEKKQREADLQALRLVLVHTIPNGGASPSPWEAPRPAPQPQQVRFQPPYQYRPPPSGGTAARLVKERAEAKRMASQRPLSEHTQNPGLSGITVEAASRFEPPPPLPYDQYVAFRPWTQ
ncbi:hypothetical protein F5884DRAFT_861496 [Xylogone sp. PMI_703]|nr:hypothetical protein F5884DRAFT_861496 [Xylogone sp. PMI_703]